MYAFGGATGFSENMLAQIHQGFANLGRQEEFWPLLLSHVRDHVPEGLEGRVSITLKDSHRLEEPRRDQFGLIQEWILSRAHLDPQVMTILRELYLICHRHGGAGANNAQGEKTGEINTSCHAAPRVAGSIPARATTAKKAVCAGRAGG